MTRFTCRKTAAVAVAGAVVAAGLVAGANPAGAAQAADIPTVTKVSESTLSLAGGDVVSITGTGFRDETTPTSGAVRVPDVYFDGANVTTAKSAKVIVLSDTRLIAVVPDMSSLTGGSKDVVVENSQGFSLDTVADDVNFVANDPSTFDVYSGTTLLTAGTSYGSPAGGDTLTLIGTDLQKATKVTFDGVATPITKRSTQGAGATRKDRLTVKTPAHAATGDPVEIKVFTPKAKNGVAGATKWSYAAPITGQSPATGKVGAVVSLRGLSLDRIPATGGLFLGATAVTDYIVVSETEIVAVVPSGASTGKWATDVDAALATAANSTNETNEAARDGLVTFTVTA